MSLFDKLAKNKAFVVQVRDNKILDGTTDFSSQPEKDPMESVAVVAAYSEIAKDFITHASLTIGGVFVACKVVERICR